ncbi:MAG: murein biosynthesis integral membrane protein MurJ [Desulfosarcina sp.]|nr:murein biosynthesis integral membrane protein MurJ [Desulfobacterales bacterium]
MTETRPSQAKDLKRPTGVGRKVGLAAVIMMGSILLSRVTGLVRESVIAATAGTDLAVDAYRVAFIIPELLNHILASGFLSVTFIPIFTRYLSDRQEEEGWRVLAIVLTTIGSLLVLLIGAAMLWAPQLIDLLAPGRDDPLFKSLAVRMTRIIMPAQLFFFVGGLFAAVQFARERFFIPALAPLVYNLGIILGGLLLGGWLGMEGFAWGVLAGALAGNCLLQYFGARAVGLRYRPVWDWRHPDLVRYVLLTLPLMFGLTMTFSMEIFSKLFGSYLPTGNIARIEYAIRIMMALVAFFGQAVGGAVYPFLARFAAGDQLAEMNRLLNRALRHIALVIPFAALAIVIRHELVFLVYQRMQFTAADTAATSRILGYLLLGAVGFAGQTIVNRGFYARQNTILPTVYGSLAVLVSLPVYFLGMRYMGADGIGAAIAFSAVAQVLFIYMIWNRRSENRESRRVYGLYLKLAFLSLPLGLILGVFKRFVLASADLTTMGGNLLTVILVGSLGVVLMVVGARLAGIEEMNDLVRMMGARVRKKS